MKMTLSQYIRNPMGSAVFTAAMRETMHEMYTKKYGALMVREHGKIDYQFFKDIKNNLYYAVFKIPSETIEKFYYDVVLEFSTNEDVKQAATNLFEYDVRFFSNDPAFMYTYAYTFYHNDLFIDRFKSKMSKKALKKAPEERNPTNQIGYVKTIYFAYLTMLNKGLNNVATIEGSCKKFNLSYILNDITDADTKIGAREAEGAKLQKKKQREKQQEERKKNSEFNTKTTSSIKTTKIIGSSSSGIKKVKSVKTAKKK